MIEGRLVAGLAGRTIWMIQSFLYLFPDKSQAKGFRKFLSNCSFYVRGNYMPDLLSDLMMFIVFLTRRRLF